MSIYDLDNLIFELIDIKAIFGLLKYIDTDTQIEDINMVASKYYDYMGEIIDKYSKFLNNK